MSVPQQKFSFEDDVLASIRRLVEADSRKRSTPLVLGQDTRLTRPADSVEKSAVSLAEREPLTPVTELKDRLQAEMAPLTTKGTTDMTIQHDVSPAFSNDDTTRPMVLSPEPEKPKATQHNPAAGAHVLRNLIRDVVRQELQNELNGRFGQTLRALVQQEILRSFTEIASDDNAT